MPHPRQRGRHGRVCAYPEGPLYVRLGTGARTCRMRVSTRPVSLLAVKTGRLDSVRIHQEHQQDQVDLHLEVTWNPAENLRTEIPADAAEKDAGDISVSYDVTRDSPRWH